MSARVVIDEPCGLCDRLELVGFRCCGYCHGTGTVQRVVTCETCEYWRGGYALNDVDGGCTRANYLRAGAYTHRNRDEIDTTATHGCNQWEARDAN